MMQYKANRKRVTEILGKETWTVSLDLIIIIADHIMNDIKSYVVSRDLHAIYAM